MSEAACTGRFPMKTPSEPWYPTEPIFSGASFGWLLTNHLSLKMVESQNSSATCVLMICLMFVQSGVGDVPVDSKLQRDTAIIPNSHASLEPLSTVLKPSTSLTNTSKIAVINSAESHSNFHMPNGNS
eukprot:CAMPEP_0204119768 /NCGR_PEP_ID=MMETSP0361-20130328/7297_1 /ASSEMBLY_ACC=CAM_ASM_000343 /TAXON_ID=268821 /ORGANISM="Scrippsiella Hangoei, Strain SHTV-5" /LENGTH=127 /DNA_ID=CAMNT_0051070941 /DNA_START=34 /DNA_END=413 /DNA_ORIENTATION=-